MYKLLGGKSGKDFPVFYCVWPDSMEKMVEHTRQAKKDGYFVYQVSHVIQLPYLLLQTYYCGESVLNKVNVEGCNSASAAQQPC